MRQYGFVNGSVPQFSAEVDPLLAHCTDEFIEMVMLIIIIIYRSAFGREIQAERTNCKKSPGCALSEIYRKEIKLLTFSSLSVKHA